jgi:hypothetical protein
MTGVPLPAGVETLGSSHPHSQLVPGASYPGVTQPGREPDRSPHLGNPLNPSGCYMYHML